MGTIDSVVAGILMFLYFLTLGFKFSDHNQVFIFDCNKLPSVLFLDILVWIMLILFNFRLHGVLSIILVCAEFCNMCQILHCDTNKFLLDFKGTLAFCV